MRVRGREGKREGGYKGCKDEEDSPFLVLIQHHPFPSPPLSLSPTPHTHKSAVVRLLN